MAATDKTLPVAVRAFVQEKGLKGAGSRGRISREAYLAFFQANPRKVRDIATAQGVTLPKAGKARQEAVGSLVNSLVGAGPRG